MPSPPLRLLAFLLLTPVAVAGTIGAADARPAPTAHARRGMHVKPRARTLVKAFAHRRAHGTVGLIAPPRPAPATAAVPATPAPGQPVLTAPLVTDVLTPPAAPPTDPAPAAGAPTPPAAPVSTPLGIQTRDTPGYQMLLSRPSVPAGTVRLQLQNGGEDSHNVLLTRTDGTGDAVAVPLTAPRTTRTSTVQLTAGTYRLICTLTTPVVHDTAGMHATLTVTP